MTTGESLNIDLRHPDAVLLSSPGGIPSQTLRQALRAASGCIGQIAVNEKGKAAQEKSATGDGQHEFAEPLIALGLRLHLRTNETHQVVIE